MPPPYLCDRCGFDVDDASAYRSHIYRINTCNPYILDTPIEKIRETFENGVIEKKRKFSDLKCKFCPSVFTSRSGQIHHNKICKFNPAVVKNTEVVSLKETIDEMKQQMTRQNEAVMEMIRGIAEGGKGVNVVNNINNPIINNPIIINPVMNNPTFIGSVSVVHIMDHPQLVTIFPRLLNGKEGMMKYINVVHFNEKAPQNHNIRRIENDDTSVEVYDRNGWVTMSLADTAHECMDGYTNNVYNIARELPKFNATEEQLEVIKKALDRHTHEILEPMGIDGDFEWYVSEPSDKKYADDNATEKEIYLEAEKTIFRGATAFALRTERKQTIVGQIT